MASVPFLPQPWNGINRLLSYVRLSKVQVTTGNAKVRGALPGIVEQADDGVVKLLEPIIGILLLQGQSAILRAPKKALCFEAVRVPNV